ncbi:TPA: glucose-1-phosphate adenylyltransferase subunit GlgD [Streptococcus agalactiae]
MKIDKYTAILGNTVSYPDMHSLTDNRPLASLPFYGKYRLIDFQLSSLANAGVRSIYGIFRGNNVRSVFDHIRSGREWGLGTLLSHYSLGFYDTDDDTRTVNGDYYDQILTYLRRSGSDQTIYMSCDMLCNIDLSQVIHLHNANGAQATVVYKKMPRSAIAEANQVLTIDESDHVVSLGKAVDNDDNQKMSAEIYVIDTPWLIEKMEEEAQNNEPRKLRFLLRDLIVESNALAFEYTGYLSNISSIKSYYDANMDMLTPNKFYSLFFSNQKVYTKVKNEEATYFDKQSNVSNSQLASGSIIKGYLDHSIVSRNCLLEKGTRVVNSIIFPKVKIGEGATIENTIIDKCVKVASGVTLKGSLDKPLVIPKFSEINEDIIQ